MTLGVIAVLIGGLVVILNSGGEADPTDAPAGWDDLDVAPAQELSLGEGPVSATVVVGAEEALCWAGYIVSEEIEGCGPAVFEVSGGPRTFGVNARHTSDKKAFIGIAVWSDNGQQLEREVSVEKFGVVALTAYPNPVDG